MSNPPEDPVDAIEQARPGDVVSYTEDADKAPPVGARMTIVVLPDRTSSHLPNDNGPWQVANVEPGAAGRVKVYIRLLG